MRILDLRPLLKVCDFRIPKSVDCLNDFVVERNVDRVYMLHGVLLTPLPILTLGRGEEVDVKSHERSEEEPNYVSDEARQRGRVEVVPGLHDIYEHRPHDRCDDQTHQNGRTRILHDEGPGRHAPALTEH